MFNQWTRRMDFLSTSLQLRAHRQELIASNIANADTPGHVARDFNFAAALREATSAARPQSAATDSPATRVRLGYSVQTQPSMDGNSVDLDQQRANFTDNAIRYESTLRFINGHVKTMLSAIQGQ
jgi:flagellar basal-body rod protein FlgB